MAAWSLVHLTADRQWDFRVISIAAKRKQNLAEPASFIGSATAIGFQPEERVTAIVCVYAHHCVCVCVCMRVCDLSRQVTEIRVRGEDDWLQRDETQTHGL